MDSPIAYDDAIDLLDADHKAVKKMFIDYNGLRTDNASPHEKRQLSQRICQALSVHMQIEEEIFYPAVRQATGDKALIEEAQQEHLEAKRTIVRLQGMEATVDGYDDVVQQLSEMIDEHVLEEREEIFLEARYSEMDLRGLAVQLFERKKELQKEAKSVTKEAA